MIACFYIPQAGIATERARLGFWGEPLALVADGIVVAASDEAARHGVQAQQNGTAARSLCPRLVMVPYDTAAYAEAMKSVWNALAVESSTVEPASPEFVFTEITGRDAVARIRKLAQDIAAHMHISIRVGVARSKMVAQLAALRCADGQLVVVPGGTEAEFLAPIAIAQVECIAPKVRDRLQRLGLRSLGDIQELPSRELQRQFRGGVGLWLQMVAQGKDGERIRATWPPRCVEAAVTWDYEVGYTATVLGALQLCAQEITCSLVREREFARHITLFVRLADGSEIVDEVRLFAPTDDAQSLLRVTTRLLHRLPIEQPLVGVRLSASELGTGSGVQLTLLDTNESGVGYPHERRRRLEESLAYCRARFGAGAVVSLRLLHQSKRIHRWTGPLTRGANESIHVATDPRGMPVRYYRRGMRFDVQQVQDRWRETEWYWDSLVTKTVYRVETRPPGTYQLHRVKQQWRMGAMMD